MSTLVLGTKRRWTAAALGAAVVVGVGVVLFRVPVAAPAPILSPPPAVSLTRGDAALNEEMAVRDPRPLFLPTEFNTTLAEKDLPAHEPGKTFLAAETTRLTFNAAELDLEKNLPPIETLNNRSVSKATSVDALTGLPPGSAVPGFGREEASVVPLSPRGGIIEIEALATGRRVRVETIPVGAGPRTDQPWQPVEFLAAVDPGGLVGQVTWTPPGSGVEDVDLFLRNYLATTFRVGDRLPPGFYRITVAP